MSSRCSRLLVCLQSLSWCCALVAQAPEAKNAARLHTLWKFAEPGQEIAHVAAHAGLVIVTFGKGGIAALRADDGSELWRGRVGKGTIRGIAFAGEPKVDAVVLTADKHLGVLDRLTGESRWVLELPQTLAAPVVVGKVIVAGGDDGKVHGRSLANGDELFATDYLADAPADPPGFDGKQARYGEQVARPGPAVSDGESVFFSVFDQCRALAVDANSGARKAAFPTRGWMFMQPTLSGRLVLVGSQDGRFHCFDKADGSAIWSHQTGARVEAACTVRDDRVFWGSCDGRVYCLGLERGDLVWQQSIGSEGDRAVPIYEPPVVAGQTVMLAAMSGEVVALDRGTGQVLGRHRPSPGAEIDGSAWDGSLLFVQTRKTVAGKGEEAVFAIGR